MKNVQIDEGRRKNEIKFTCTTQFCDVIDSLNFISTRDEEFVFSRMKV